MRGLFALGLATWADAGPRPPGWAKNLFQQGEVPRLKTISITSYNNPRRESQLSRSRRPPVIASNSNCRQQSGLEGKISNQREPCSFADGCYAPDTDLCWEVKADCSMIEARFTKFTVEEKAEALIGCPYDFVKLNYGREELNFCDHSAAKISKSMAASGRTNDPRFTGWFQWTNTFSNELKIQLKSDSSVQFYGFDLEWRCAPEPTVETTTPGMVPFARALELAPRNTCRIIEGDTVGVLANERSDCEKTEGLCYYSRQAECWKVETRCKSIRIRFNRFEIEEPRETVKGRNKCTKDKVLVVVGGREVEFCDESAVNEKMKKKNQRSDPFVAGWFGWKVFEESEFQVKFETDDKNEFYGFDLEWECHEEMEDARMEAATTTEEATTTTFFTTTEFFTTTTVIPTTTTAVTTTEFLTTTTSVVTTTEYATTTTTVIATTTMSQVTTTFVTTTTMGPTTTNMLTTTWPASITTTSTTTTTRKTATTTTAPKTTKSMTRTLQALAPNPLISGKVPFIWFKKINSNA